MSWFGCSTSKPASRSEVAWVAPQSEITKPRKPRAPRSSASPVPLPHEYSAASGARGRGSAADEDGEEDGDEDGGALSFDDVLLNW